jgi:peptidoglycan/LPS O-acetylase OafA/YrhL
VVVLSHSWLVLFPAYPIHWPGEPAVVVFFVLSGLVIAFVADGRHRTLADYALDRLSRLWSVALPALGFALVLLPFVAHPSLSPVAAAGSPVPRSAANALFLGETWFYDATPPLNGPFWSLNYEAWFYAIFGAWAYLPGRARLPAAGVLAALAGPKILLLMPCWLFGVWVYRSIGRWNLSETAAVALWAVSLCAALLLVKSGLPTRLHDALQGRWPGVAHQLAFSGYVLTDYPLAVLVALNFYAAAHIRRLGRVLLLCAPPIRACASYTLTTYLFHVPLLVLSWDVLHLPAGACLAALAASIAVVGNLTERRRRAFRAWLAGAPNVLGDWNHAR